DTNRSKNGNVKTSQLIRLRDDLIEMKRFWNSDTLFEGALVSVYYNKIAAKSNRVTKLLAIGSNPPNSSIVGAKFSKEKNKHIITHLIQIEAISVSIININQ